MILSAQTIRELGLLEPMLEKFTDSQGNSAGLSYIGYDLTLDQDVTLAPGRFKLASTREHFTMPDDVAAIMHDKSSLARRGLAVQNTVAEPGWRGYLTLELTNHGTGLIALRAGDAICQAIFHRVDRPTAKYVGKYQDQPRGPQAAKVAA